jgi:hypothetical protein
MKRECKLAEDADGRREVSSASPMQCKYYLHFRMEWKAAYSKKPQSTCDLKSKPYLPIALVPMGAKLAFEVRRKAVVTPRASTVGTWATVT